MVAFFGSVLFPSQSGFISFTVLPWRVLCLIALLFIPPILFKTIRSLSLCCEMGSGRLGCCVHLLQLWFCSYLSVISRAQPARFLRKNSVKIIVAYDLPFIKDTAGRSAS